MKQGKLEQPSFDDCTAWIRMHGNHDALADEMYAVLEENGYLESDAEAENRVLTEKGLALWQLVTLTMLGGRLQRETVGEFDNLRWYTQQQDHEAFTRSQMGDVLRGLFGALSEAEEASESEPEE